MRLTRIALVAIAAASLALGACSSSSKSSSTTNTKAASETSKSSASSKSLKAIDACALLSSADIRAVDGTGTGKAFVRPEVPGVQWDSCTWGEITNGKPMVIVQVQQLNDAPVNALKILLSAGDTAKNPATAVEVGNDGKLYNVAILAGGGGGGVGKTIAFKTDDSTTVAVSLTGTNVDVTKLTTLAETVANQLS